MAFLANSGFHLTRAGLELIAFELLNWMDYRP